MQAAALVDGTVLVGTTWQVVANFAEGEGATIATTKPKEGATGWSDTWMLSSKAAAEPGRWRTSRTPYLREIMDCLSPASPIERVAGVGDGGGQVVEVEHVAGIGTGLALDRDPRAEGVPVDAGVGMSGRGRRQVVGGLEQEVFVDAHG